MSILILLAVLIVFIPLVAILIKLNGFSKIGIPLKAAKIIIIVYLGVLLISAPVMYFIPKSIFSGSNKPDANMLNIQKYKSEMFRKYADKGELDKFHDVEKNKTYHFDAESDVLHFETPGYDSYPIWVEEKQTNDGIIDVQTYTTPYIANGIDVTKKVPPIDISYRNALLKVVDARGSTISMISFKPNFLMKQFEKEDVFDSYTYIGVHAIYIKIPQGMILEKTKNMVTFVKRGDQ